MTMSAIEHYEHWKSVPDSPSSHSDTEENNTNADSKLEKKVKKRVRTGCFNCRRKHKKCDEQKPTCKACFIRKEECEWPSLNDETKSKNRREKKRATSEVQDEPTKRSRKVKTLPDKYDNEIINQLPKPEATANQKALDNYTKNLENIDHSLSAPLPNNDTNKSGSWINRPGSTGSQNTTGLTPQAQTHTIGRSSLFTNGDISQEHLSAGSINGDEHQNSIVSPSISPGSATNQHSGFPFLMSPGISQDFNLSYDFKSTLRDYMFANASNFELTNDVFNPNPEEMAFIKSDHDAISFLTKHEEKQLLKNFLYKVAPWLDMFDLSRQIGIKTTQLAKKSPSLRYAILALSSRQMEKTDVTYDPSKSVILYQTALKHLIPTVNKSPDIGAVTACVILCVFEMMSISPEKWRYHLDGCSALFKATTINGFSSQYERALFWVFARMDVNSAVIGEESTMIPSERWLPDDLSIYDAESLFKKENSYEMYANYIVFLCSRVMNLITSNTLEFEKEWQLLWDEVTRWHRDRPAEMKSIIEVESSPFPEILYDNGPAISGNQLYHMAMILMMENKPRLVKINCKHHKTLTWHAKQIVSISYHNDHHGCWNNAVQTLWIAGRLLTHEDEHRVILDLLNDIEATTGWAMKFRAKDLVEFWSNS